MRPEDSLSNLNAPRFNAHRQEWQKEMNDLYKSPPPSSTISTSSTNKKKTLTEANLRKLDEQPLSENEITRIIEKAKSSAAGLVSPPPPPKELISLGAFEIAKKAPVISAAEEKKSFVLIDDVKPGNIGEKLIPLVSKKEEPKRIPLFSQRHSDFSDVKEKKYLGPKLFDEASDSP